jgi:hypothetical protein
MEPPSREALLKYRGDFDILHCQTGFIMKSLIVLLLAGALTLSAAGQELECTVTISTDLLTAEAREILADFTAQAQNYINSYRWTDEDLGGEKIAWTINISFQGSPRQNRYTAQAFIGSQRRIYRSEKNTALLRVMDDKWEFDYQPNQQILHDESMFEPLASFLDFYSYVVIGLDFESYQPGAGVPYLEKAMNVVNTARSGGKGWEAATPTEYSRGQFVDELLSAKYEDVRKAIYRYHYLGLDLLYNDPERAKRNILMGLEKIGRITAQTNQPSQLIKVFFDTKYLEIAETFRGHSDPGVYTTLMEIDPGHRQTYEEARDRME